jgi:hypothetical protein
MPEGATAGSSTRQVTPADGPAFYSSGDKQRTAGRASSPMSSQSPKVGGFGLLSGGSAQGTWSRCRRLVLGMGVNTDHALPYYSEAG